MENMDDAFDSDGSQINPYKAPTAIDPNRMPWKPKERVPSLARDLTIVLAVIAGILVSVLLLALIFNE
jgi:hypothetical protein